jgi:feruloyl esterase
MRLPLAWNGRYYQRGCGGFCGEINIDKCDDALARDFVVAASNMGHVGLAVKDPVWGDVPEMREDYGALSAHKLAVVAKAVTQQFYGKAPAFNYLEGCSTGGREGLGAAQHHPEDFDGIVAGDPAFAGRLGALANNWDARHLLRPDGSSVYTPAKLAVLAGAVMSACDELDGVVDGIIMDPRRCTYDPAVLQCAQGDAADCLTQEEVTVARAIYEGPRNSAGQSLMPGAGAPRGSELSWSGAGRLALAGGYLRYLAFEENPPSDWDWREFDFDQDVAKTEASAALYDPVAPHTAPDLRAFNQRGGKLLVYHGWADPGVTPFAMLDYYGQVSAREGGMDATRDWFRLFMVPGMYHCRGGNAPNTFDMLTPIVNWVEKGVAPDGIVAHQLADDGSELRSRPLFAYPAYAALSGEDPDRADSWTAALPEGAVDDRDNDWIWAPAS